MTDDQKLYDARIIGRQVIGQKKIYFIDSEKYPLSEKDFEYRKNKLEERGVFDSLGFATVWQPDATVADVKRDLSGFNILSHDFISGEYVSKSIGGACHLDCAILGAESNILRNSKSKKDYLSKFVLQDRFRQKYGFKL